MYNKRQYRKYNDKKILHKVGKQWQIISLSLLMAIGGFSVAGHSIKAYADNNANNTNAQKILPNASTQLLSSKYNKFTNSFSNNNNSNNHNDKTIVTNSPSKSASQNNNQNKNQESIPNVNDIVTAINDKNWNQKYGNSYADLLSKLNYSDVKVLDNPTAYNNYINGNRNITSTSEYKNNLSSIQQDLSAFSGYSEIRSAQNLMNLVVNVPSLYSFPLFNGYETSFTGNDSDNYNDILTSFSNLESDHNNNDKQITDLKDALSSFNKLSSNAQNSISNFYEIQPSDINNEITNLRDHVTSQGMQYQPIKLTFYDISSRPDPNSSNEQYIQSRAPVGSVILNESDFGSSDPETMVNIGNKDNSKWISNSKLQVPSGYIWNGLVSPDGENSYKPDKLSNENNYNNMIPKQQLHFHLVPASKANQPEEVDAYVSKAYSNTYTVTNEMNRLRNNGFTEYSRGTRGEESGVYGKFYKDKDTGILELGGDFSKFINENDNDSQNGNGQHAPLIPSDIINKVEILKLDDSVNLRGNCSYMFSNMPNLQRVISNGNFDIRYYNNEDYNNKPSDMSDMFANDPKLRHIEGLSNWNVSDVTNMNSMFYGDTNLSDFTPISHWDTGSVNNMDRAFANSGATNSSLSDLNELDLRALTSAQYLFSGDNHITDPSPWNNVQMGEGKEPSVSDMFNNTGINNDDTPNLYRTENGNYTIAPTSNVKYFTDSTNFTNSKNSFKGIFYTDSGTLVLKGTSSGKLSDLPSTPLSQWITNYKIDPSSIKAINIEGNFSVPYNWRYSYSLQKYYIDFSNYFANLYSLRTIDLGDDASLTNNWNADGIPYFPTDANSLFAHDPELDNVIGFFGNEQALKNIPTAGDQATGLIDKKYDNGPFVNRNMMNNNISTAHMFDGDSKLFIGDNAQANVDAISSIPMSNVRDASYMFSNTGLSDSNITTDWNLANLQNASHMFAGCNLSNLNGFNKLGNWTVTINTVDSSRDTNDKDIITKVVPTQLQNASYMFANNPHLSDISGISGNNISINPITDVSDMFNGDTDLQDASYIENGNNKWDFTQKPKVDGMFGSTGVGYSAPEFSQRNSKYILEPAPETDIVYFNGDLNNNTNNIAKQGTRGTSTFVTAPNGYHFSDNQNSESFTFNGQKHTFNVAPNQYTDTINYVVQNNNGYTKHGQTLGHFTKQLDDNQTNDNNIKFAVNNSNDTNIPAGYHLVNGSTIVGNHQNNSTDTVWIAPNSANFTVNFMDGNQNVGHKTYNGLVDNSFTVNGKTVDSDGDVPYDYAINNGQSTNFIYNTDSSKNNASIKVSPQCTSETIDYVYSNGNKSFNEGSNIFSGTYNTKGSLSNNNTSAQATGLKAGWQINGNQSWTYSNGSKNISVKPINALANVKYVDSKSNVLGSHTFNGNDSRAIDAGNNNVYINNSNELGIPSGYHLSNKQNIINFDNGTHYVSVLPNAYTETINYVVDNNSQYAKKNERLNSYTVALNDERDSKADNTSLDISNSNTPNIPEGYQLVNTHNVIKHPADKNYSDNVLIKPKYVTNYVSFNGDPEANKDSISGYYDNNTVINNAPSDYHYTGTHQITLGTNDSNQSLNVAKNVIYIHFNGDNSANTSRKTGDSTTISAPSNYHFNDGNATESVNFSQNGNTFTFGVTKNADTDTIKFNGDSSADTTIKGVADAQGNVNAPNGYHFNDNKSSESFTFNNGIHTFDVNSNTHTIHINFSGDTNSSTNHISPSGNYQTTNATVTAPAGYHFTDGKSSEIVSYSDNNAGHTYSFNVDSNIHTVNVHFIGDNSDSANITKTGNYKSSINISAPTNYHFTDGKSTEPISFSQNGTSYSFNVAKNVASYTDTVNITGSSNSNVSYTATSGTNEAVTAPNGYHFTNANASANDYTKYSFNMGSSNSTINLNDASNSVFDSIIYSGDNGFTSSANGMYNTSASVSAPSGYHFTTGSSSTATFNLGLSNSTINLNIASNSSSVPTTNSVIDTVIFNGDNNSSESISGNKGSNDTIAAPSNYHFTNGNASSATFNLGDSNSNINLNVASNTVTEDVTFNGDSNTTTNHTAVSGMYSTSASVSAPSGYHFTSGNSSIANISLGVSDNSTSLNVASNSSTPVEVTDVIQFKHGTDFVKQENKTGQRGTSFDVKNDVPSQYNVNSGTQFTFDGKTHVIQLGINRPNSNNVSPVQINIIDTIQFKHGNQIVKSETKQGQQGTNFDVKNDIPSQFNVNSGTVFTFDGQTHTVQLGVSRPNGNQTTPTHVNPQPRPNGNQTVLMKTDTFNFEHGGQLIKSIQLVGQNGDSVDVSNLVPSQYNAHSNTGFIFDGNTHVINLGVNRSNDNKVLPVDVTDTIQFKHGNDLIKRETKAGQENVSFNVSGDIPSQYNVNSGTQFTYDGQTHVVQLGVSRPNGNQIAPTHVNPQPRPNSNQTVSMKTDTFDFKHGNDTIESIQLAGQANKPIDVASFVPSQYNVHSNTNFTFDGDAHVINLGVNRPNGNQTVSMKTDIFNFDHGNQLIKSVQLSGQDGTSIDVSEFMPNNYNEHTNTQFTFDGQSHVIELGISRPNNNNVVPVDVTDTIQFKHGDDLIKQESKTGQENASFNVNGDVPSQYNVNSGTQFIYDGKSHVVQLGVNHPNDNNVLPVQIDTRDNIVFNGDNSAKITEQGELNANGHVNAPINYHFINGSNGEFTFNGSTHTFDVAKNTVTPKIDTIIFNGDSDANTTMKGIEGTQGNVSAPSGYHFSDNKNSESFTYNGNTHVFNVTKNSVVPSVNPNKPNIPVKPNTPNKPNNNGNGGKTTPNKPANSNKPINPVKPSTPSEPNNGGSVIPSIPFIPSNPVVPTPASSLAPINSTVASNVTASSSVSSSMVTSSSSVAPSSSAQSVHMTNKNYPIQYDYHEGNNDVVTYHGKNYDVHYHSNGKNTISARVPVTIHGRRYYRHHDVVVSINLPTPHADSRTTQMVDRINFNQRGKRIFTRYRIARSINNAKSGRVFNYRGHKYAVIEVPNHFRFFMVRKNSRVIAFGKNKSKLILKPNHLLTVRINRIFVTHGRHANYVRYEIRLHHHNYWVSGRDDFVPNSYWQSSDLKSRRSHRIQVINNCGLYTSHIYNSRTHIKGLKRGTILHVKKVINLGRKSNCQTRFVLTNGDFVTANKNFVGIYK